MFGAIALTLIALACAWTLYANLFGTHQEDALPAPAITIVTARPANAVTDVPKDAAKKRGLFTAPVFDITLINPARSFGLPPVAFSQTAPLKAALQAPQAPAVRAVQNIPLPTPRPAEIRNTPQHAMVQPAAPPGPDNLFDRFFGKSRANGPALAYASADGGVFNDGQSKSPGRLPGNDGQTAVYDISARTVYMPDGSKLEAHSGLHDHLDDPRYVHVKMRGATPPHTYDLVPREALFHGVEALRMIPVGGESEIFGRTGLLAHTYMLGPNGDSNGCVSFKDYGTFLRAYKNGQVKRLIVVASGGRAMLASTN
ncbi:MAG: DUF2778 domain-containing protein [Alphaproteobacteria bacterium]|nr:MAG: DUF2778 domain-containing protein [Alphaproteobacteria bacterium]